MSISAHLLIGARAVAGTNGTIHGINPANGETLEPAFGGATPDDLEQACALAWSAFDVYRETTLEARAAFLERIAENILAIGDALIVRCMAESGLPRARLEGERGRTVGQLRLFAAVVRAGDFLDARIDPAQPQRQPLARVDLRLRNIPLGPVAVFGASNFPLAFSVGGGDTASALAAGCPVIVKAHSAHPGTSVLVGRAIQQAVADCGLPEGTFSLLFDSGRAIGQALVSDWRIKAVGFTGSRGGGTALMHLAAARHEPIPVYAEMSSINPVLLFPQALATRAEQIGQAFAAALTLGAGQFCTNPGLILAVDGPDLERFIGAAEAALSDVPAATMLTPGIHHSYAGAVQALCTHADVTVEARGQSGAPHQGQAALFSTTAQAFRRRAELQGETFGAASLIVRCPDLETVRQIVEELEGQLTAALHVDESDYEEAAKILPALERRVGRILVNGFGTGVEVGHAMVHGGPFPSTSDGRSTSVGSNAIARFLRPVSYQDVPDVLLPDALKAANPLGLARRLDGSLQAAG
ncbi:aldehyde dehydrogenase (NADP(+)) [Oxalobacteraceae bacterium]|nr:aldehyde dehydrogenase (NADP(+)) [Oxalobacteraceae bacterium]